MKGLVTLRQSCKQAFADRTVFASCEYSVVVPDGGPLMDGLEYYYNIDTLEADDGYMKECLESRGRWSAMPRDDPKYLRAHARHNAEKVVRQLDQLRNQVQ